MLDIETRIYFTIILTQLDEQNGYKNENKVLVRHPNLHEKNRWGIMIFN